MSESETKILKILHYPDPFLKKKARPITAEELKAGEADGHNLRELVERMIATMYEADGVGLAGPQVGIGLRLFVGDASDERNGAFALINPGFSGLIGSVECEEGCLSVPEVRAKVKRAERLTVSGYNAEGTPVRFEADGLLARVCQHETDHLDGKLFIDHIGAASRFMLRRSLKALEDDYEFLHRRRQKSKAK